MKKWLLLFQGDVVTAFLHNNMKYKVGTYDEILKVLKEYYDFRDGEPFRKVVEEKQRLLNKMNQ